MLLCATGPESVYKIKDQICRVAFAKDDGGFEKSRTDNIYESHNAERIDNTEPPIAATTTDSAPAYYPRLPGDTPPHNIGKMRVGDTGSFERPAQGGYDAIEVGAKYKVHLPRRRAIIIEITEISDAADGIQLPGMRKSIPARVYTYRVISS